LVRQKALRSLRPGRASAASGSPAVREAPRLEPLSTRSLIWRESSSRLSADEVIEAGLARLTLDREPGDADAGTLGGIDEPGAEVD
jgi:hypothetical protein